MATTKIQTGAFPADVVTTAAIDDLSVTHAKLHTTMDLSSKTVTLPSAITDTITNKLPLAGGTLTGDLIINTSSNGILKLQEGGADKGYIGAGGGGLYIKNLAGDVIFRNSSDADTIRIKDSGNVGIGTSSPQPFAKLEVAGSAGAQTGANQAFYVRASTATANEGVGIRLSAASGSHEAIGIIGMVNNATGNAGSMTFHTYNLGATIDEQMRIDNTGNVGIGTTSPTQKLEVTGNILAKNSGNPYIAVLSTGAGNNPFVRIQADTNYWDLQSLFSNADDELDFRYNGTSKMMITSAGNVGIGTTSPVSSVDIGYGTNGGWEGASSTPALAITQSDAYRGIALRTVGSSNVPATLSLERAQTSGAQTSDGDDLGRVLWNGSGGSYVNRVGASIKATQHGAYSGGYLPAKLDFFTSSTTLTHNGQNPASGTHASRFRINPAGDQLINGQFNYHVISGTSSPNVAFSYDFYRATYGHPIKITCAISHWSGGYMSYTEGMYWGYNTVMSANVHHSYNGGNGSWTISFPTNDIVRVRMNGDAAYSYGSGWYIKLEGNLRREYTSA